MPASQILDDIWGTKPWPHVWHGFTAGSNETFKKNWGIHYVTPAAIHWLSAEPLLEDMEFDPQVAGLDWCVFGAESGSKARRCEVSWIRRGVRRCQEAGAKVYVKQLGTRPYLNGDPLKLKSYKGEDWLEWPKDLRIREFPEVA